MSAELNQRLDGLFKLNKKFKDLVRERPWAVQKISLQGLTLAKECITKIKNQCQINFQQSWKERQDRLQEEIVNLRKIAEEHVLEESELVVPQQSIEEQREIVT